MTSNHRAITVVDLVVALVVTAVALAALAPTLRHLRGDSGQQVSRANLETLAFAHALYAWDWDDRQVTWIPDDAGVYVTLFGGSNWASPYILYGGGCPQPFMLGWDDDATPTFWGYYIGCGGQPGNSLNGPVYTPLDFAPIKPIGSCRLPNAQAMQGYVDGRFYSPTYYAPNDTKTYDLAFNGFDDPQAFTIPPPLGQGNLPTIQFSSYALSPAAMYDPEVFALNRATGTWWRNPNSYFDGYLSPTVSQCANPELKTRIIEHNWNVGAPGKTNPAVSGGFTPYQFNHGLAVAPLTLFFDGHVTELPNEQVVADDAVVLEASGGAVGLWTRDTPFGSLGYGGAQSYDGTLVSHHMLTADGILGRDVLHTAPRTRDGGTGAARSRRLVAPAIVEPTGVPWG